MARMTGISGSMKWVVGAGIALVVWAILGVGIGLFTLYNTTTTGIPPTVLSIAQTLVAVGAGIGVALKFFE